MTFTFILCATGAVLAAAGLHHHLMAAGLRSRASIIVETGEAREVMHFALLVGYGVFSLGRGAYYFFHNGAG